MSTLKFKSRYPALRVNTSQGLIMFEDGKYATDDLALQKELLASKVYGLSYELAGEPVLTDKVIQSIVDRGRKTPWNAKKKQFHLLIGCQDFTHLTGMPVFNYRLGRELVRMGCAVTIVAPTTGGSISRMATKAGIRVVNYQEDHSGNYNAMLLSELWSECLLDEFPDTPAWYYCHSKYECDAPIPKAPQVRGYLAPREQVADHWWAEKKVECQIVPIPIDFKEFKPKDIKHEGHHILVPCTFNNIREPMVDDLLKRARQDKKIKLVFLGTDFGVLKKKKLPANAEHYPPTSDVRKWMAWADEVAGIFVGTVTLEAWAMGKKCSVYDEKGKYELMEKPADLAQHDVRKVAERFLALFKQKWADIIIPHYDQTRLLAQTLKSIPLQNYNVIVVRGGTFAENCNKGAKLAVTDNLIFANDDLVINRQALWNLIDAPQELVGIRQFYPDGEPLCVGIFINKWGNYELTNDPQKAMYPSGALFRIKKAVFEQVGGFNEGFRNGGEDQDLFLQVLEAGYRVGFAEGSVTHYCSQSTGRFDYIVENDELLHSLWTDRRLRKVLGKNYKK